MTDYKKLYFKLFAATEDAIQILVKAQQECEEVVISEKDIPADQKIVRLTSSDQP